MTRSKRTSSIWLFYSLCGALFGTLISLIVHEPLIHGLANGFLVGLLIAIVTPYLHSYFRQRAVIVQILTMSIMWSVLIMISLVISHALFWKELHINWLLSKATLVHFMLCFGMAIIMSMLIRISQFLGNTTLKALILGQYITPKHEQRIFLFLDIADSTAITQRVGPIKAQQLMGMFLHDVSHLIRLHSGEVQRYVGDNMMATWPLSKGVWCVAFFLEAVDKYLKEHMPHYLQQFGVVPKYRIGIDAGEVVAKEIGEHKRSVEFFGNAVNIAARLEKMAKILNVTNLLTQKLAKNLILPNSLTILAQGKHAITGFEEPHELVSLSHRSNNPQG
ncbi:adenylate/guanylate cyclase domain-containing protein [Zooshikella harenae]|uniref:Adenylate/guanylate cyclase domain-containing protein n=1 Tax=Zooshikella harenae TaxID=2827238 RepID=A0ABS5ZH42_9GAMM|nr:adenylate/guanylate cyclase domain-containing protein [Zooshikella harenae]MBU2713357.1 adenylate/guanylate cyclase domain-containing protein [Zooshikella harenae]